MESDAHSLNDFYFLPVPRAFDLSAGRECIVSHARRLAERNQIPLIKLLSKVLLPAARSKKWSYFTNVCALISGNQSRAFTETLQAISGQSDLEQLTAAGMKRHHGLAMYLPLSKYRKWCSGCFQSDAGTAHGPYDRLAWRFELVSYCPVHKSMLCGTCPHCGAADMQLITETDCSGFCPRCRGWLGAFQWRSRFDRDDYSQWASVQIHALVNHPDTKHSPHLLIAALKRVIAVKFQGSAKSLADALGCAKSSMSGWLAGKGPISTERLIEISFIASIPVDRLLSNSLPARLSKGIRPLDVRRRSKSRRNGFFDIEVARRALISIASGHRPQVTDRLALLTAAGASRSTLRRYLPAEYKAAQEYIRASRKSKTAEKRRLQEAAFDSAMNRAIDQLLAQTARLSRRKIAIAMSINDFHVNRTMSKRIDLRLQQMRHSGNSRSTEIPA